MQAEMIRIRAVVRGRVQMVGFREFVLRHARSAGIAGTVANRPDGTVVCIAEGRAEDVELLLERLREGPRGARVEGVEVIRERPTGSLSPMRVTA